MISDVTSEHLLAQVNIWLATLSSMRMHGANYYRNDGDFVRRAHDRLRMLDLPNLPREPSTPAGDWTIERQIDALESVRLFLEGDVKHEKPEKAMNGESHSTDKSKRRTIDDWLDLLAEYESDLNDNPKLSVAEFARAKDIKPDTARDGLERARCYRREHVKRQGQVRNREQ